MFVIPCAIVAHLSLYLSSMCFGLMVRTRSRPYGLCHHPHTKAHIKGFGLSNLHVYACLLLCFMLVLALLVLGFTTFNALSRFVVVWLHPTPIRPCLGVIIWDASLDARSLCVHAWVLLASVLSMLQHNEVMDIQSRPIFVPCRHHHLFILLLGCFFACLFPFLLC